MADQAIASRASGSNRTIEFDEGKIRRDMLVRRIGKIGLLFNPIFVYFFLWAPIIVLVVFSFNAGRNVFVWQGFSLQWYSNIFNNTIQAGTEAANFNTEQILNAVGNTLVVGISATIISTILGTLVALSLVRGRFPGKRALDAILYLPVVIPEIAQGVSLLVFFKILFDYADSVSGTRVSYGIGTIIIGHVVFCVSYVAIVVRARLADMNPRLEEAARDLGANEWRTFWRVTFPLILPGVVAGALLAFTISLDDFVVTFFVQGVGTSTLPILVYSMLKRRVPPEINAISTLMLLVSTILVGISLAMQGRNASRRA